MCFAAPLHGFAFWFDVEFSGPVLAPMPISYRLPDSSVDNNPEPQDGDQRKRWTNPNEPLLSTAPEDPPTHWQQVQYFFIFIFEFSIPICSLRLLVSLFSDV